MTERVLTPPIDSITAPVRSNAVDIVKGLAIFLVVYEHTAQGMFARGWWNSPSRDFSYFFVYTFHMPAFFFVAGLFVAGSIKRRGVKDFVLDKVQTLLYVYILWAALVLSIDPLIARFKNSHHLVDWRSFPLSLIDGTAGWFFPVLFLCLLLALLTIKLPAWLRFLLAAVIAVVMPNRGYEIFAKTPWNFAFLAGGMLVGRSIFKLAGLPRWAAMLSAAAVFALQVLAIKHFDGLVKSGLAPLLIVLVLGFTGTAGLFFFARTIENTLAGAVWAWIGQASLGIFLLAQFFQGAVRQLLLSLCHTQEFWWQLVVPTLVSVAIPAVIWHRQRRWRIAWLFRWPFGRQSVLQ